MTNRCAGLCLILLSVVPLSACGDGRSPEAFCSTMDRHKERYLDATDAALGNVERGDGVGMLAGTVQMVTALGDLQVMWKELAEVAPEDIQADVETIRDTTEQQLDAATSGDPASTLTSSVLSGLTSVGSYQRVDAYVREHCDG